LFLKVFTVAICRKLYSRISTKLELYEGINNYKYLTY